MDNSKLIFVSAYCQNPYQEERIRNFVKNQGSKIINPSFNIKKFNSLDSKVDEISLKEIYSISKSDEVWLFVGSLDSNSPENKVRMYCIEENSTGLNKPLKYIYIYCR